MNPLGEWRIRLLSQRGRINILTVVIVLAIAAAIYMAIMIVPAYVEYYKFEEKLRAIANQTHRVKDQELLLKEIHHESKILGLHLPHDAIKFEWDPHGEWVEISTKYNRVVKLVPFGATFTLHFESNIVERFVKEP
jgi:hypothetical protein